MQLIVDAVSLVVWMYLMLLIARMVIGLIVVFSRDFQPKGVLLIVFETVFSLTDPPLKALRKVIPSLRIGQISLDLAFLVLFILLQILLRALQSI